MSLKHMKNVRFIHGLPLCINNSIKDLLQAAAVVLNEKRYQVSLDRPGQGYVDTFTAPNEEAAKKMFFKKYRVQPDGVFEISAASKHGDLEMSPEEHDAEVANKIALELYDKYKTNKLAHIIAAQWTQLILTKGKGKKP